MQRVVVVTRLRLPVEKEEELKFVLEFELNRERIS